MGTQSGSGYYYLKYQMDLHKQENLQEYWERYKCAEIFVIVIRYVILSNKDGEGVEADSNEAYLQSLAWLRKKSEKKMRLSEIMFTLWFNHEMPKEYQQVFWEELTPSKQEKGLR